MCAFHLGSFLRAWARVDILRVPAVEVDVEHGIRRSWGIWAIVGIDVRGARLVPELG